MAHRASFRRGVSQSQRRKKSWAAFVAPTSSDTGSSPSGVTNITLNFELPVGPAAQPSEQAVAYAFAAGDLIGGSLDLQQESTLLRIRGSLIQLKNTASATKIESQAFGIAVVESTNLLAPAKFPNPANPVGAAWDGWMFYRSINSSVVDAASTVIDVKSMRKVQSGYSLIFVAGSYASSFDDTTVSAPAIISQLTARGLFLLP